MDITSYQSQLFKVIERSHLLDGVSGRPVEKGLVLSNYTDKIQERSYANNSYERCNQLDGGINIGTFGKANSQRSKLLNGFINCNPRENEDANRFNYAIDKYVDRRMEDVSGQSIPNNMLRVIPNRGIQLYGQKRNLPRNDDILNLSLRIGNISASALDKTFNLSKSDLQYKASHERLSRGDLLGLISDRQPLAGNKNNSSQTQSIGNVINKMKDAPLSRGKAKDPLDEFFKSIPSAPPKSTNISSKRVTVRKTHDDPIIVRRETAAAAMARPASSKTKTKKNRNPVPDDFYD